ncbi:PREDICTED: peptide deformylase, mitochondrial-like [Cyphomyrmex costatus]|uniref:Peptide deformylase n=1 Tax=Cyphomyrmex costatus TaxID=456900 RepID=A0A195CRX4_9HYME|nr:PREDICTED: peptide deformylase, mitochondrial-like [Cyphomyrmex costatus]KYN03390.1 Peptide deformylase, mitochondrial [Cyphomyrmex costatus]
MFRIHHFTNMTSRVVAIKRNDVRFVSIRKIKETVQRLLGMHSNELPYRHICQVGDPVLRGHTMKIEPEVIRTAEFQNVIKHLINVMRAYNTFGLSGPQIGLPWQIFAIQCTEEIMEGVEEGLRKTREMNIIPVTIFINPELKVIDYTPITLYEGCGSILGYSAAVPRAYEVEIKALNASAEQFTWKARGWSARIAQHEYDHLQGKLYIEKMDVRTFHCMVWDRINKNKGKIRLTYST